MDNGHDQVLYQIDYQHRIYLCEYGLVHVHWGAHRLHYCPGDMIGLPFLLDAINPTCDKECLVDATCPHKDTHQIFLPYGSVQIPLTKDECQSLHLAVQKAVQRLQGLKAQGYFGNQTWLPPQQQVSRNSKVASSLL